MQNLMICVVHALAVRLCLARTSDFSRPKDWCKSFRPSSDSWAENKSEGLVCGARAGRRLKSATRPYIGAPVTRTLQKAAAQAKGGLPSEALSKAAPDRW